MRIRIPFDIKYRPQIESGEYKVETIDGFSVEILKWDLRSTHGHAPILALIHKDYDLVRQYSIEGCSILPGEKLFLITPELELTEFEQEVRACVTKNLTTHIKDGNGREMISTVFIEDDTAKKMATELLELARKELEPEVLERLEVAYKNQDEVVYENGVRDGKAEALKDLPRWEKTSNKGTYVDASNIVYHDGYYLGIKTLEKLPGFKED